MLTLQQQKDIIDAQAQITKNEADKTAILERQAAADEESRKIRVQAEYDVRQVQDDAQK